ncbi:MAG TPA: Sec-independent protein translocase protein TatB [Caulobacteraceae bacterium]|jgi:sec-independent protein translocase protein TatB
MFPEGRIVDFMIVAAVALIVVGPKDLPILMRKVGQFVGRMRGMAAEFRASFDEIARQSELDELRREVEAMRADAMIHRAVGLDPETDRVLAGLNADLNPAQPSLPFAEAAKPPEPAPALPEAAPPNESDQTPVKAAS